MNKILAGFGVGALMMSSAVGARSEFGFGSAPDAAPDASRFVVAQAAAPAPSEPVGPAAPPAPAGVSYQGAPTPAPMPQNPLMQDPQAMARIEAQIDALMQAPSGGFAVTYYAKPAPPPPGAAGQQAALAPAPPPQRDRVEVDGAGRPLKYVVARAGDSTYATLDRAFNSDDPQGQVFATIHDVDNSGIEGPLDGVRLVGKLTYSSSQGAIEFQNAYLPDGRPLQLKALAVSEDTARTGIAKNVDQHLLQRYGSLVFASVVQGAGQVGQILLQNNQSGSINPVTGLASFGQNVQPYQAILAGALPVGQALTAAAAQNFNQPATITAPAGTGIGIVFTEPVVLPRDVLFAHAAR